MVLHHVTATINDSVTVPLRSDSAGKTKRYTVPFPILTFWRRAQVRTAGSRLHNFTQQTVRVSTSTLCVMRMTCFAKSTDVSCV